MEERPCQARNYFLACYAVSLAQGQTLLGKIVRSATIKNYLKDACSLFKARKIPHVPPLDTDYIHIILTTLQRYEDVPNRRNMITDDMMHWLLRVAKGLSQDDELVAILDWLILGRYSGFRKSEWCQSSMSTFETITDWPGQPPLAFIFSDFRYLDRNEGRLPYDAPHSEIWYVEILWRKQKNGNNGESKKFARDNNKPRFCPVRAAIRIIARALRLSVPEDEPMAVFKHKSKRRVFITDTLVAKHLRGAASAVLNINKSDDELNLWSTHSIRVTAANLLHREKFADSFIMKRLRWSSYAFMDYLRDTIYAAEQHAGLKISDSNLPSLAERSYRLDEPHEVAMASATS